MDSGQKKSDMPYDLCNKLFLCGMRRGDALLTTFWAQPAKRGTRYSSRDFSFKRAVSPAAG
jgi:hypothetical protein